MTYHLYKTIYELFTVRKVTILKVNLSESEVNWFGRGPISKRLKVENQNFNDSPIVKVFHLIYRNDEFMWRAENYVTPYIEGDIEVADKFLRGEGKKIYEKGIMNIF